MPDPSREAAELSRAILEDARVAEEARRRKAFAPARAGGQVGVGILLLLCAWVWVTPPGWLVPRPAPPPAPEEQLLSLRLTLYLQGQQVEAHRIRTGRLPLDLSEVGPPFQGMEYRRISPEHYQLTGRVAGGELVYISHEEPLVAFLGDGADILEPGGAPREDNP